MPGATLVISGASWIKQEQKKEFAAGDFEGSHPEILLTHSTAYASTEHVAGNYVSYVQQNIECVGS